MRRTGYLIFVSGLIGLGSTSCGTFADECFNGADCSGVFGSGGSSTTTTTTTTTSTMSSTSTGVIPGCDGELTDGMTGAENKGLISDICGVFVQADATVTPSKGTQASPYTSLQTAIAKAGGRNVYVCTSAPVVEAVTIQGGVTVYGGLDCKAGWKYDKSARSQVEAPEEAIAVTILAKGVSLNNLGIKAGKAKAAGSSAIAVLASGAEAELVSCLIEAGPGVAGADGTAGGPITGGAVDPAAAGTMGTSGKNACIDIDGTPGPDTSIPGGIGPMTTCGLDSSVGGDGGSGKPTAGTAGTPGLTGAAGAAGAGEPASGVWGCGNATLNGTGAGGEGGIDADGGTAGKGKGTLSLAGYLGASGGTGLSGVHGQGGGGGGGTKGGLICSGVSGAGASGGSGGSGGCGGAAGRGGGAGGSSIAVASVGATLTLTDCSLKSGKGGNGGKGGDLQPGGAGGDTGKGGMGMGGSKAACDGGKGGQGGNGSPGGGGQGGHSLTIAYLGTPVSKIGKMDMIPGTAGVGGPGGNSSVKMNAGDSGKAMPELIFP